MWIDYFHISAFTEVPGRGNSAAVLFLDEWISDHDMATVAKAIGLPVTSFVVDRDENPELRWLTRSGTPVQSMCGHGTIAAACAMSLAHPELNTFIFTTPGGPVHAERDGKRFKVSLPRWDVRPANAPEGFDHAIGGRPDAVFDAGRDLIAVFDNESDVRHLEPDMDALKALGRRGIIATARGKDFDCVSRFFCPSFGIGVDEDPVTGSAHCSIAPFWADRLGKSEIHAYQASREGGEMICRVLPSNVQIAAPATLVSRNRKDVQL